MARTNSVNFTGPLQYPMANAATDLFKKEDVQTLALAVDGHDHSSGKGLILPASAIPPITNAMLAANAVDSSKIQDGSIQTADLANAVIHSFQTVQLSSVYSSTATGWQVIGPSQLTMTCLGVLTRIDIYATFNHSVANQANYLGYSFNGSPQAYLRIATPAVAGLPFVFAVSFWFNAPGAGSQTFGITFNQTGTLTLEAGLSSYIAVTEYKR
jgi:hypothetical protein